MGDDDKSSGSDSAFNSLLKNTTFYEDSIQPGAKELGSAGKKVGETINALLSPLNYVIWKFEYFKKFVDEDVAKKLENTPPEDIIQPKLNVAGPLFEGLRYSDQEEILRDMFANLLANAMDKKTASNAHPSFIEILKQITSDEAKILKHFSTNEIEPIIEFRSVDKSDAQNIAYNSILRPFSILGEICECEAPLMTASYLENLDRLGLVEISYGSALADESRYKPLLESVITKQLRQMVEGKGLNFLTPYGIVGRSFFGSEFCKFCVIDKASQTPLTAP